MVVHLHVAVFLLLAVDGLSVQMRSSPKFDKMFMLDAPNCTELYPGKCAPYAVILGEDKCGTNAVAAYLNSMGLSKQTDEGCRLQKTTRGWCGEVNWNFNKMPSNFPEASRLRRSYGVNFPDTDWKHSATYDKSTTYFRQASQPGFIDNFKTVLPNSKLIAVLCDPVDRVWSRMQMLRETIGVNSSSKCPWNFQKELTTGTGDHIINHTSHLLQEIDKGLTDDKIPECKDCPLLCMVLRTGDYAPHITAWTQAYGSNFRYFISEDIKSNPDQFIGELFDFLKYVGAKPRHEVRDVGDVHTRVNDPTYWKKEGALYNSFNQILTPRFNWTNIKAQRQLLFSAPHQAFNAIEK